MRRNLRLERLLRKAAIAEKELRRREEERRERQCSQLDPNPLVLWCPGAVLWDQVVLEGINLAADAAFQSFQDGFRAVRRM